VNPKIFLLFALGAPIGLAACSSPPGSEDNASGEQPNVQPNRPVALPGAPSTSSGNTGSVGLSLTLPGGAGVSLVSWTIAGPNGAATVVTSGSVDVGEGAAATFLVSQIPPASGYTVVLSAKSTDGGVSCEGSATFAVTPRATTKVAVQLGCSESPAGGQTTLVNGTTFDCATWNTVTANPAATMVGTSVALAATAAAPVQANVTYQWSASSGQFGNAAAASTTFTCSVPGPVNVTLTVGDGTVPKGSTCNPALDTDVITVTCTGTGVSPPPPAAPALPLWALLALAINTMGLGCWATRRRPTA
jgi:hypothetical protein